MQIQSIYPPLYMNDILDTSLTQTQHETDEAGDALEKLNYTEGPVQTRTLYLEPDQELTPHSIMNYDMYGGLQSDSSSSPGALIDTYA
jgi:hypothetical protein